MERSEIGPGVFPWQSSYVLTIHITELLVYFINIYMRWRFRLRRIGIYDVPRCVRGAGVDFPFGGVRGSQRLFPEFFQPRALLACGTDLLRTVCGIFARRPISR